MGDLEENLIEIPQGVAPGIKSQRYANGKWEEIDLSVPKEMSLTIYINSQELVTILCTPLKLKFLVIGYMLAEGIINDIDDITYVFFRRVCVDDAIADVKLKKEDFVLPVKRVLTSGCGGGMNLIDSDIGPKLNSKIYTTPEKLLFLMQQMQQSAVHYRTSGGIHTSAICDSQSIIALEEDIGRHNTIDKIIGECMMRKISTKDKILITSGRISSEMLRKAAKMQTPIIVSLTSPTERAILLAQELNITLVGYARGSHLTVYSKPERLGVVAKC
ncbi:formate dehydrogenase accessory sulfurtransferase FdhD [Calorimonas adulescens]|uniref:formate dehydrogenase accessory sulfurtransferase FdhD n=1 Tax=Calorimonas adulescens TaxID=2606906 RepID=UPI0019398108|nr:formate dehydrogenase accessory sulfurtransferase FdhD [Calorimonas adulescens]